MALLDSDKEKIRKDFMEWSGGFGPHEYDKDYVECGAYPADLDPDEVDDFIEEWRQELDAREDAKPPSYVAVCGVKRAVITRHDDRDVVLIYIESFAETGQPVGFSAVAPAGEGEPFLKGIGIREFELIVQSP